MTNRPICHLRRIQPMSPRIKPVLRSRRWKKGDIQGITPEELQQMIKVAKGDRYAKRNECMLLIGFSFGLRVSELLTLKIEDVDLDNAQVHLERLKNGKTHDPSISKALQRTLKAYIKERGGKPTDYLFPSQWNSDKPLSRDRKSTRLNSSHLVISYAVFCLQKKTSTTTI